MPPSGKKRSRHDDDNDDEHEHATPAAQSGDAADTTASKQGGTSTNFRNVSACNRCRHRKNRCDQRLPRCSACVKADAQCVGFDPVSKREIPRSYVYFLETRVRNLEALLTHHNIPVPPPRESFPIDESIRPGINVPFPPIEGDSKTKVVNKAIKPEAMNVPASQDRALKQARGKVSSKRSRSQDLRQLLPQTTMQPPGLSFSKVVFAAVRNSVSQTASERGGVKGSRRASLDHAAQGAQDCFFGLHTRPSVKPAPFPDRDLALHLVMLYFEHANPQVPILHRGEYMQLFERVYAKPESERTARELYLLNIVFAIGAGIILDGTGFKKGDQSQASQQRQPEEYHASAVAHLETFLHSPPAMEGHGGGMEELQAVLLLAALALLRPVAPGLWYIIGVAVRLAVDLGLHFEDSDPELDGLEHRGELALLGSVSGRKQWKRDLRRRLWWCVYSYDRLVSTCVGRPFGVTDQVITTAFPSLLADEYITKDGFTETEHNMQGPTYKLVTHHYVRLRLLQSEILQVLQYRQAQRVRSSGHNTANPYMHTQLSSPFLHQFASFREWRADVDRRLGDWRDSAPTVHDIGVMFKPSFFELNYWQAVILLYRQSLAIPAPLAKELSATTGEQIQSPGAVNHELEQDKQQVLLKIAQAGQMVIKTYVQLHRLKLVNYTFLSTHHIFMSGVSFLYALWNSSVVRGCITHDDVDFVIMAATSILSDLIEKCPPAEACRDAFHRMSKATIAMVINTTGFGSLTTLGSTPVETPGSATVSPAALNNGYFSPRSVNSQPGPGSRPQNTTRVLPRFDMDLKSLFQDNNADGSAARGNTSPLHTLAPIQSPQTAYRSSTVPPISTLAHMGQAPTALSMANMEYLDAFGLDDAGEQYWMNGYELDPGFGAGGTAGGYDDAHWDPAGSLDMLNGFYFGNGPGS